MLGCFVWGQKDPKLKGNTNLYIAKMDTPWSITGPQVMLSRPEFFWEQQRYWVNEGPAVLQKNGRIFLTYSASACWSDGYSLGLLSAAAGANLLDPASWRKSPMQALASSPARGFYAPGHNGFFKSPDGKQDWIIFHANGGADWKCTSRRAPYIMPFHWKANGEPDFIGTGGS